MPIYVDVSSAVHAKAGIGRYAENLARALIRQKPERFALFYNRVADTEPLASLRGTPVRTVRAGYKPWRMAVWLGQLAGAGFNRLLPGVELFHATEHLLPPLQGVPTVLTVHDMIFRLFPEHQKRLNYWYLNATMPLYCRKADAIITVSESSKQDIVQEYQLNPQKVSVIPEAAAPEFVPASPRAIDVVRQRYGLPERFAVHVSTIEPRKNLTRLAEALERLHEEGVTIPLVAVGGKGWLYDDFFRHLQTLEIRDQVLFPGYVPTEDLPAMYSAATLSVMPSVYEGFGLPVLEAMACGVPVVASQSSSLPEVGGAAARYFDPYSVEEMAEAIRSVWVDDSLQAEMRGQSLTQAARFSWEQTAGQTLALYERVLDRTGGRAEG